MKTEYPKCLYHVVEDVRVVNSLEEQEALGPEWKESPADHEAVEPAPAADAAPKKQGRKK